MPLIKDGALIEDRWTRVADETPLPDGPVIVSLARWQAEREGLTGRNGALGILLASSEAPEAIAEDLDRFDLVCLDFPKFQDGRAYSHARKLRQRFGYEGELRAVGNVLRDQFAFMVRCGFDSFAVADGAVALQWTRAMDEISVVYQPAADARATASRQRQHPAAVDG
jgi:uncharacterized protein (DUF934 family)